MRYAKETDVSVEKTKAEIESCARKYGATSFYSGYEKGRAAVGFEMRSRQLRFILPLPDPNEKRFTYTSERRLVRNRAAAQEAWEQACRQLWRALLLSIKAKLEAVECGIAQFDSEFLAHIVLPNSTTIGDVMLPELQRVLESGKMPRLLPGPAN